MVGKVLAVLDTFMRFGIDEMIVLLPSYGRMTRDFYDPCFVLTSLNVGVNYSFESGGVGKSSNSFSYISL